MTVIGFVSWKGGTGKSLLAFNAAERATAAGLQTLLCDFDPQLTLLRECDIRSKMSPECPQLDAVRGTLSSEGIANLRAIAGSDDHDLIVCDMPGADSFTMDQALNVLDLMLIPITAAPFEIMITANLVHKGIINEWPMVLVPNNLPAVKSRRRALLTSLNGMGIEIAPVSLVRRVIHWDATLAGQSVCEYAPNSAGALEMDSFWKWLQKRIGQVQDNHVKAKKELAYA